MDITEFLTARWDEREHLANQAKTEMAPLTTHEFQVTWMWALASEHRSGGSGLAYIRSAYPDTPDDVIADVAAKRAIVALHEPVDEEPDGWCNLCDGDGWPCETMALLAQPYANHPDFDPDWRTA